MRLLRDNDPATVALLKEQLLEFGSEGIAALRDLLSLDDEAVTSHVREVLERIEIDEAQDDMLLCAHLFPEHGDIEAVWWLLTLCFEPEAPVAKLRRQLDGWGRRLRTLVAKAGSRASGCRRSRHSWRKTSGFAATPRNITIRKIRCSAIDRDAARDSDFTRDALRHRRPPRAHADRRDQSTGAFHRPL